MFDCRISSFLVPPTFNIFCFQGYRLRTQIILFSGSFFLQNPFFMFDVIRQYSNQSSSCRFSFIIKTLYSTIFYPFSSCLPWLFLMQIYRHDLRIQLTEALDANQIQDMSSMKQTLSSTHNSLVAFYKCTFYVK